MMRFMHETEFNLGSRNQRFSDTLILTIGHSYGYGYGRWGLPIHESSKIERGSEL